MIDLEKRRELGKAPKLTTEELVWSINHHYNDARDTGNNIRVANLLAKKDKCLQ